MVISDRDAVVFVFVSYAIVLSPFVDTGLRNYLVLLSAFAGSVMLAIFRLRVARDLLWNLLLHLHMVMVVLATDGAGEIGSVALTFLYSMGYFAFATFAMRPWFDLAFASRLLRGIVIAFAIVSVIQFATSFAGLPVPNLLASKGLWSYNSLSFEPSQLGRAVGITMLAYLIVERKRGQRNLIGALRAHKGVALAFFATMLLSGSALAAIAIPVVLLCASKLRWSIILLLISIEAWPLLGFIDYEPLRRAFVLLENLGSFEAGSLFQADASGAIRLVPVLIYFEQVSFTDWAFWFGHGSENSAQIFLGRIPAIVNFNGSVGFLPGFMSTYGVIGFLLLLWTFGLRLSAGPAFPVLVFWLLFFSSVAWNMQLFWYGLIILRVIHQVEKTSSARGFRRLCSQDGPKAPEAEGRNGRGPSAQATV